MKSNPFNCLPLFGSPVSAERRKMYVWFEEANGKIGLREEEGRGLGGGREDAELTFDVKLSVLYYNTYHI